MWKSPVVLYKDDTEVSILQEGAFVSRVVLRSTRSQQRFEIQGNRNTQKQRIHLKEYKHVLSGKDVQMVRALSWDLAETDPVPGTLTIY